MAFEQVLDLLRGMRGHPLRDQGDQLGVVLVPQRHVGEPRVGEQLGLAEIAAASRSNCVSPLAEIWTHRSSAVRNAVTGRHALDPVAQALGDLVVTVVLQRHLAQEGQRRLVQGLVDRLAEAAALAFDQGEQDSDDAPQARWWLRRTRLPISPAGRRRDR